MLDQCGSLLRVEAKLLSENNLAKAATIFISFIKYLCLSIWILIFMVKWFP